MITMTQDQTSSITASIGPVIRDRMRELRERAGLTRAELAGRAVEYGAGESFSAAVVGFLERGRRGLAVDELLAVAAALEVSPLELLGDQAGTFIGVSPPVCPRCDGVDCELGPVQTAVRADVERLGELKTIEPSLAASAYALAKEIDAGGGEGGKLLAGQVKELRATLKELAPGRRPPTGPAPAGDLDDDLDDLGTPD